MRKLLLLPLFAAFAGCAGGPSAEPVTKDAEQSVRDAELRADASKTLSSLVKIEESLATYVKEERRIPEKLDELIPKYLAEIPPLELGVRGHRESSDVRVYPAGLLRDGQIDGSQLKDTGRWGYVHNDRQVVVFVDCTHLSPNKRPWYQEHGAY